MSVLRLKISPVAEQNPFNTQSLVLTSLSSFLLIVCLVNF